MDDRIIITSG